MATKLQADASPEKRLFIHLLTRDIPMVAAILDLIDNSINAAIEPLSNKLKTASDYQKLLVNPKIKPSVDIALTITKDRIEITDTASGISSETARHHVFKFGRPADQRSSNDRLSVYGIGLKRALFKLGNKVVMRSEHVKGGFDLNLDVAKWSENNEQPWRFEITTRNPKNADTGTKIVVSELYDEVSRRIDDGVFEGQLRDAIAATYAYYLAKIVNISVNGKAVDGVSIELGENREAKSFEFEEVTVAINAGIGVPESGGFRAATSGWFVFCNGRAVIFADKTQMTGWGGGGLPIFQPKHRPFLGTVFFVSSDPEQLPWTTTKSAINEDSALWQTAKRQMSAIGRVVISFLDGRYTDEGTEVDSKELQQASGTRRVNVVTAAAGKAQSFKAPKAAENVTVKVQYDASVAEVKLVAKHLKKPSMSASDVGRHTFNYFVKNEVGAD